MRVGTSRAPQRSCRAVGRSPQALQQIPFANGDSHPRSAQRIVVSERGTAADRCILDDEFLPTRRDSVEIEEHWAGSDVYENEWQRFRTRREGELEMTSAPTPTRGRSGSWWR